MNEDDFDTMARLIEASNARFDGHLSILKFTTNWRVSFSTPNDRDDIKAMFEGETFDEAAFNALRSLENA